MTMMASRLQGPPQSTCREVNMDPMYRHQAAQVSGLVGDVITPTTQRKERASVLRKEAGVHDTSLHCCSPGGPGPAGGA